MVAIGCEDARPRRLAPERRTARPQPAPDRLTVGPELDSDVRDGGAGGMQPCGVLIACLSPRTGRLAAPDRRGRRLDIIRSGCRRRGDRRSHLLADLLSRPSDSGVLVVDDSPNSITEVGPSLGPTGLRSRCQRSATWTALGAPWRAPSA